MTRTRSRDVVSPKYGDGLVTRELPGFWKQTEFGGPIMYHYSNEGITDKVTSGFHKKIAEGEVVINPVSHVKYSAKSNHSGRYEWTRSDGSIYKESAPSLTSMQIQRYPHYMCSIPPEPTPSWDMTAATRLQALGSVDRTPYSFAEDIAEMRETLRFLRNPLQSLRNLSKELSDDVSNLLNRRKALKRADAIADVWLQYQFAFMPLVRSASDAIDAFGQQVKRPKRRTARGVSVFSDSDSVEQQIATWLSSASHTVTTTARSGILYEVSNPLGDWKFKYGLRFKDIPETLWAIFPYSFMVDRVLNISQAVRGFASFLDPNVKMLGAWDSVKKTRITTISWLGHISPIVVSVEVDEPDTWSETFETYDRSQWIPTFSDLVPELRIKGLVDTSSKIADLAALIYARVR